MRDQIRLSQYQEGNKNFNSLDSVYKNAFQAFVRYTSIFQPNDQPSGNTSKSYSSDIHVGAFLLIFERLPNSVQGYVGMSDYFSTLFNHLYPPVNTKTGSCIDF